MWLRIEHGVTTALAHITTHLSTAPAPGTCSRLPHRRKAYKGEGPQNHSPVMSILDKLIYPEATEARQRARCTNRICLQHSTELQVVELLGLGRDLR